jgi:hypothetical protein
MEWTFPHGKKQQVFYVLYTNSTDMHTLSKVSILHIPISFGLLAWAFFALPTVGYAQESLSLTPESRDVSIELTPRFPRPGEQVRAVIKQYLVDPDFSLITWTVNNEVVLQGYGEVEYIFVAGPAGSLLNINVSLRDQNGRVVAGNRSVRINDISFVWEARTYTPPFFMGRPKFSYGAEVAIIAYPLIFDASGKLYDISDLTFTWAQGARELKTTRGVNSFITRPNTPFNGLQITVIVSDPAGVERMSYYFQLAPSPSRLLFYEDDPSLGLLYRSALPDSFDLRGEELKIVAEPLYGTAPGRVDPSLSYTWTVNDSVYQFPGSIVLRPESGLSGTTDVSLVVLNTTNYLERLQHSASVQYSAADGNGDDWTDGETNPL